jgi:hypothetical protein
MISFPTLFSALPHTKNWCSLVLFVTNLPDSSAISAGMFYTSKKIKCVNSPEPVQYRQNPQSEALVSALLALFFSDQRPNF